MVHQWCLKVFIDLYSQVKDADNVNHNVIGTHFLDLSNLSNEGDKGEFEATISQSI